MRAEAALPFLSTFLDAGGPICEGLDCGNLPMKNALPHPVHMGCSDGTPHLQEQLWQRANV
jgi:hypothetical protein